MRQRFREMQDQADARANGQAFLHLDGQVFPAISSALRRVRDNAQPNTPDKVVSQGHMAAMFNSRRRGA